MPRRARLVTAVELVAFIEAPTNVAAHVGIGARWDRRIAAERRLPHHDIGVPTSCSSEIGPSAALRRGVQGADPELVVVVMLEMAPADRGEKTFAERVVAMHETCEVVSVPLDAPEMVDGEADLLREAIDGVVGEDPPARWQPTSGQST